MLMLHIKRMPDFTSAQYTANKTSRAIQDQECCPTVTTNCYNNCQGEMKGLPTITKDLGYKPASWHIAKRKPTAFVCVILVLGKINMNLNYMVIALINVNN